MVLLKEEKRLFFGLEILAPWSKILPKGRLLLEQDRHLTLAFLGNVQYSLLESILSKFPAPSFSIGLAGQFDECLSLPPGKDHVIAWHVKWFENEELINQFQKDLVMWLKENKLLPKDAKESFLPHVTLCRQPFYKKSWMDQFVSLPLIATNIHLYESLGFSRYQSCWSYSILPPFEEIGHTADIAFLVHGTSMSQLHLHAQVALAFKHPAFLPYLSFANEMQSIEDIVMDLNDRIARLDEERGSPFKAVSFHDKVVQNNERLTWEMIVDV